MSGLLDLTQRGTPHFLLMRRLPNTDPGSVRALAIWRKTRTLPAMCGTTFSRGNGVWSHERCHARLSGLIVVCFG